MNTTSPQKTTAEHNDNIPPQKRGMIYGASAFYVAANKELAASLPDDADCPACNQLYLLNRRNPVRLPCGHIFCHACVSTKYTILPSSNIVCPFGCCFPGATLRDVNRDDSLLDILKEIESGASSNLIPLRRILVFGSAKSGKTSMLNCITNQKHPTDDSAIGRTLQTKQLLPVVVHDGVAYVYYDTAGLNAAANNGSATEIAHQLVDFVKKSRSGFNLLVYVFEPGAVTETIMQNYELFAHILNLGNVPVLAVVTHCENYPTLNYWADRHKTELEKRGLAFVAMVGACFKQPQESKGSNAKFFEELNAESGESVLAAIRQFSKQVPTAFDPITVFAVARKTMNYLSKVLAVGENLLGHASSIIMSALGGISYGQEPQH